MSGTTFSTGTQPFRTRNEAKLISELQWLNGYSAWTFSTKRGLGQKIDDILSHWSKTALKRETLTVAEWLGGSRTKIITFRGVSLITRFYTWRNEAKPRSEFLMARWIFSLDIEYEKGFWQLWAQKLKILDFIEAKLHIIARKREILNGADLLGRKWLHFDTLWYLVAPPAWPIALLTNSKVP